MNVSSCSTPSFVTARNAKSSDGGITAWFIRRCFPRTGRNSPHFPPRVCQAVFHDMSKTKTFGIELLVSLVCLCAASQADDAQARFDSAQYTNGALHLHITNAPGS